MPIAGKAASRTHEASSVGLGSSQRICLFVFLSPISLSVWTGCIGSSLNQSWMTRYSDVKVADSLIVPQSGRMASEEYIDVTCDGGVRKRVIVEGTGESPPLHAQCLGEAMCHTSTYVGLVSGSSCLCTLVSITVSK